MLTAEQQAIRATGIGASEIASIPPGLHADVPHAIYHARVPGLVSKSALDLVARSPAHYKAWLDGAPEETTPALEFGSAFHCALLEPERFEADYAVPPNFGDCRFKENKARRDAWLNEHDGATLLSASDAEMIAGMVEAVRAHPLAGKMIRDGQSELTLRWDDAETGLRCKGRVDYYVERLAMAVDVKSALDARPDAFRKAVANYRYHVQDAIYREGFAATGKPLRHFVFIAVEKTAPYAVAIYTLDDSAVSRGYAAFRADIATLAECMKTDTWPGYEPRIQTLSLPRWAA